MKRPSDVPPVQESAAATPVRSRIASVAAATSRPAGVRYGLPLPVQATDPSSPWRSRIAARRCFSDSGVLSVEWRKLNASSSSPGMTLVAPVPARMFEHCHVVGGKYALPSSQRVAASSAIAGAASWMGLRARCG